MGCEVPAKGRDAEKQFFVYTLILKVYRLEQPNEAKRMTGVRRIYTSLDLRESLFDLFLVVVWLF